MKSRRRTRQPPSPSLPPPSPLAQRGEKDAPRRISVDSTTRSLREQLEEARRNAEWRDAQEGLTPARRVERTKFRRKKDSSRRRASDDVELPAGKYSTDAEPLLFVDGYNVIGAWPKLRKWRDRADLETARRLLLNDVAEFRAVRGWECTVVFDAQAADLGERSDYDNGVTVVFTGAETADTYIERCVFEQCKRKQRQIWAATSDITHGRVSSGMGAHVMSATLFVQELKRVRRETTERVEELEKAGLARRAKMLMSTVDKATLKQLYELRDQLNGG